MSKRIEYLHESPCYQCGHMSQCNEKAQRIPAFKEIQDYMFANAELDYLDCPMYVALNAPEMVEE